MAPCLYFGSSSNLPPHFGFTLRPRNWLLVYFLVAVRICLHILVLLSVQEIGSLSIFWQQSESASTFWFYSPSKKLAPCLFLGSSSNLPPFFSFPRVYFDSDYLLIQKKKQKIGSPASCLLSSFDKVQ